jgi:hypothetical protein
MTNSAGLEGEELRAALARLRADAYRLKRGGPTMKPASVRGAWQALAEDLRARLLAGEDLARLLAGEERGLEEERIARRKQRLELLEELLARLDEGDQEAQRLLEAALLAGLARLLEALAALRNGGLERSSDEALPGVLVRLEEALLVGLEGAGGARRALAARLREELAQGGAGALLLYRERGERAGELLTARGWLAALGAGLEDLLRAREEEERREEERRAGARSGGAPALPQTLAEGLVGLLARRQICEREELTEEERATLADGRIEEQGRVLRWQPSRSAALLCACISEEILTAGGAALSNIWGDLLIRSIVRRTAERMAETGNAGQITYEGGLAGLVLSLKNEPITKASMERVGGQARRELKYALMAGQRMILSLQLPDKGKRIIGGLWTWKLLERGSAGSTLVIYPSGVLQPGADGIGGALLPVLAPPPVPVGPTLRAAALRLQWRWLAALRRGALDDLRAGWTTEDLRREGLRALLLRERQDLADELSIPTAAAVDLDLAWIGGAGWLDELPGRRWRLRDQAGEALLRDSAAIARGRRTIIRR